MSENTMTIFFGVAGQPALQEKTFTTSDRVGYKIDDPSAPDCLKLFYGRKTVIVPLANLGMLELDV